MIIFCSNGIKKLNNGRDSNIIKAKRTDNELHPTQKPVNLMEYLIEKSTVENDLVLDIKRSFRVKKNSYSCFLKYLAKFLVKISYSSLEMCI